MNNVTSFIYNFKVDLLKGEPFEHVVTACSEKEAWEELQDYLIQCGLVDRITLSQLEPLAELISIRPFELKSCEHDLVELKSSDYVLPNSLAICSESIFGLRVKQNCLTCKYLEKDSSGIGCRKVKRFLFVRKLNRVLHDEPILYIEPASNCKGIYYMFKDINKDEGED